MAKQSQQCQRTDESKIKYIIISPCTAGMEEIFKWNAISALNNQLSANGETAYSMFGMFDGEKEMSMYYTPALQFDAIDFARSMAKKFKQKCFLVVYEDRKSYLVFTRKRKKDVYLGYFNSYDKKVKGDYGFHRHTYYATRKTKKKGLVEL